MMRWPHARDIGGIITHGRETIAMTEELHLEIEPITVRFPEREAYRAVAMGRPEMMIRELVKNAEEAARQKPMGQRQIRIYGTLLDGVAKLTIWNRGGMTIATLLDFA